MYVRFWGTRGSIATPGERTARFGGNTSCVEVRAPDGTLIVLDCGTGARELGHFLARSAPAPLRLNLFIGHTHWDHIQGFPFFVPAFLPGAELNVYAPLGFQRSLEEAMAGQMEYGYFPVKLRELRSRIHFTELEEGFFRVGDVLVETQYLNHTAPTIAYRLSCGGATVAYVTDHEPFWRPSDGTFHHPGDQRHLAFLRGVDLCIHDAQYSDEEYATRIGWGHSTVEYAAEIALAAGVRRLALFHHDPGHDDDVVEMLEGRARARVAGHPDAPEVFAAREGMELHVPGESKASPVAEVSALRRRLVAGARVLVVSPDAIEVSAIEEVLAEDAMIPVALPDMRAALTRGPEHMPHLAIVDAQLPPGDGVDLVEALRTRLGRPNFPVIILAARPDPTALRRADATSTDYLTKPYSPPMLRTRVRAWLARTLVAPVESFPVSPAGGAGGADPRGDSETALAVRARMLLKVPVFRALTSEQVRRLVGRAREEMYPPGRVVVTQGDPADHLWVLLSGRMRVVDAPADGHAETLLGEIGAGEIFGELGILRDQPRSATVVAVERSHCLIIPAEDVLHVLQESTDLANRMLRVVAARLADADGKLGRYAPDPLTGLAGRRAFHEHYRRLAATARRRKSGLLLLLLDVQNLKGINDSFGYDLGDDVIRTVADALSEATRANDVVARYGGDEFAVLLLDAAPKDVEVITGRVREKLFTLALQRRLPVGIDVSTGIAFGEAPPETADEFLREADRDMHERKRRDGLLDDEEPGPD